ncbi:calpain-like cysteine peptidase [Novymonas esmeraldas]|uniref:Calpain-like cysteine peptidase n=1 Tax=Novymonas esmeraldas TaxID=1808958 RepID=A0AAW0EY52_9TRYP
MGAAASLSCTSSAHEAYLLPRRRYHVAPLPTSPARRTATRSRAASQTDAARGTQSYAAVGQHTGRGEPASLSSSASSLPSASVSSSNAPNAVGTPRTSRTAPAIHDGSAAVAATVGVSPASGGGVRDGGRPGPAVSANRPVLTSATAPARLREREPNKNGRNVGTGLGNEGEAALDERMAVLLTALMKPYCCLYQRVCSTSATPDASPPSPAVPTARDANDRPGSAAAGCQDAAHGEVDPWALAPLLEPLVLGSSAAAAESTSGGEKRAPRPAATAATAAFVAWVPSMTACFDEGLLYKVAWTRRTNAAGAKEAQAGADARVLWCFFNATRVYTMEIEVCFPATPARAGADALPLQALGTTQLEWVDGEEESSALPWYQCRRLVARATCPPRCCIAFVEGIIGPFRTTIRAVPHLGAVSPAMLFPTTLAATWRARLETEVRRLPRAYDAEEVSSSSSPRRDGAAAEACLAACVAAGIPFVDTAFLAGEAALRVDAVHRSGSLVPVATPLTSPLSTYTPSSTLGLVEEEEEDGVPVWARASDLVRRLFGVPSTHAALDPHVFLLPLSPVVIEPGELGDSWVVGAMATVAEHPHFLLRMFRHPVCPLRGIEEQRVGAYRVTLNLRGWWCSVVVDDYLAVAEGCGAYPRYAHSRRDARELWVSLLEKAYAKVRGGYANIVAGDPLVALRDFTGWPSAHYDISHFHDIAVASSSFASRLMRYDRHGFQVVLHTATHLDADMVSWPTDTVVSPTEAALPGAVETPRRVSASDPSAAVGLAAGMVYPVMRILQFSTNPFRAELTLLQVRNPWGDVTAWKGRWRCGSPQWAEWPQVAAACHMERHPRHTGDRSVVSPARETHDSLQSAGQPASADSAVCACRRQQYIWVEWSEVHRFFSGCGVVFRLAQHNDYRVRGVFNGACPSVCLRVTVSARTFVGAMLSTADAQETGPSTDASANDASAYPPIMLTLAREGGGTLHLVRNSQLDPDNPTARFTFMQTRDASLFYLLTPEDSPYWFIPRLLAAAPRNTSGADAVHGTSTPATAAAVPQPPPRPYVLGFFQRERAGEDGNRVEFYHLPPTSPAFRNSTVFSLDDDVRAVSATFQVKPPRAAFPRTYMHTEVSEREATVVDEFGGDARPRARGT